MPIEVKDLCYSYKKGTPFEKKVLHEVNLRIEDGDFVGLIGPTQAGKTTLAQHFNALLLPQQGQVIVNECSTSAKNADLINLRHQVGYVFQNPDYQLFAPTVGEDIAFGPKNQNLKPEEVNKRVIEAMDQVGLDYKSYKKRDIFALSGGQKRRAAIAGVLACKPQILVLDDITAGLDPRGREEILQVVRKLHRDENITIIFISNSMDEVAGLAERIIVVNQGRVAFDDTTREVFKEHEKLSAIGLELPEILTITAGLRSCGYYLPATILSMEEALQAITADLQQGQVR